MVTALRDRTSGVASNGVYATNASDELLARASTLTPGGVHSNVRMTGRPAPLFFERGQGVNLWDVDGNRYVDFVLGQGPMFLGHAHPEVSDAVRRALDVGQLYAAQHPAEVELAEMLCHIIPCAERVRFSTTGSEAVHAALRIARAYTGRRRVVKFEGHYHGWFDDVFVSVSPSRLASGRPEPESEGQILPDSGCLSVVKWNDAAAVGAELERGDVAAVIMEPIAANHSVIPPASGFIEHVQALCRKAGTVLIFDEIITGFRVGLAGAQGYLDVIPDLAVFGKSLANGFPISCVAGRAPLFDGIAERRVVHAGTFNANVASVAAALATLRVLADHPDLYATTNEVGTKLMNALSSLGLFVQGLPSLFWMGFGEGDVQTASDLAGFDEGRTALLAGELVRRGVFVTARGTWYLSGLHGAEHVDVVIESAEEALDRVKAIT